MIPVVALGQLELKDGDKVVRISLSEGLVLKNGDKQVTFSGAGAVGKSDGGHAFTGIAQTEEHECGPAEDIDVGGANNHVTLTGACGEVTVSGLGQVVTLDRATAITLSGKNNTVTWKRGDPKLTKSGSGNQAVHVK
ncbi:MAG: DUF3060 domain-containing protein [Myxococcaceae bacterium]|nr:DUF3060 domain-containing protein [Myxococcaceae bacterium]